VGTVDNPPVGTPTATFTDVVDDYTAASNAVFSEGNSNFQPFPMVGNPVSGTCLIGGSSLYDISQGFNTSWAPGTRIRVGSGIFTIYRVVSNSVLQLTDSCPVYYGPGYPVKWYVDEPVLLGQTPSALFGPLDGIFFGVKEGTLYWTKANNPDATTEARNLEVTDATEPLMNGCVYNGRGFVWSTKRMFQILVGNGGVQVAEVPSGVGLTQRHAISVNGKYMTWLGPDGIYISQGGEAKEITGEKLGKLLIPDDTQEATQFFSAGIPSPQSAAEVYLGYDHNGWLVINYNIQSNSVYYGNTLLWDPETGRWWYDRYGADGSHGGLIPVTCTLPIHFGAAGEVAGTYFGSRDGKIYSLGGGQDAGSGSVLGKFRTGFLDGGDIRTEKLWGDFALGLNTYDQQASVKLWSNHQTSGAPVLSSTLPAGSGRRQVIVDLNTGKGYQARAVALECEITSTVFNHPVFFDWQSSVIVYPERTVRRGTDFHDYGYPGRKHVRGIVIDADTFNTPRTLRIVRDGRMVAHSLTVQHNGQREMEYGINPPFESYLLMVLPDDENQWQLRAHHFVYDQYANISNKPTPLMLNDDPRAKFVQGILLTADTEGQDVVLRIERDGGALQQTLTVNHSGKVARAYTFDPPFITHHVRISPQGPIGIFEPETHWIWEPEPDLAKLWETQQTDFDMQGYKVLRALDLSLISSAAATLTIRYDGKSVQVSIPSTSGARRKLYVPLPPIKGKVFEFRLTSTADLRVYQREVEVQVKPWASPGAFTPARPFGDMHRSHGGARI
jgi:hypothetical protein